MNSSALDIKNMASIFDAIEDLVFLMKAKNDSFRYEYANVAALKILNKDQNIIGSFIDDVLPGDLAASLLSRYKEAALNNRKVIFEEVLHTEKGPVIGETSLNPLIIDGAHYVLGIVRDITCRQRSAIELKQTKMELERSNKRLQSLVDHNSDAVYELDLDSNIKSLNEKALEITGYTKEELIGQSFLPLLVEEYRDNMFHNFKDALKGNTDQFEAWIYHKNREKILLQIKSIPIFIDGELEGIYGISKDITEERRLKNLLEENRQKYKSLFDHHPDAIFTFDVDGNLTGGNEIVESFTGYSMEESIGKSFVNFIVPQDVKKTLCSFTKSIKEQRAQTYEIRLQHKDGYQIELFATSVPIIIANEVVGVYGIAKDVTVEKLYEKMLRETKEELEAFWNYSADPVFLFSDDEIIKVNPAFEKLFGYSEKELIESCNLYIPPEYMEDVTIINEKIRNDEVVTLYETKRMTKSGKLLDIIATYTPVRNDAGDIIGGTAFYKDVTKYKEYQHKLLKSEEKFRLITENAFDGIKVLNTKGIVEYVSPSYEKIIGYSVEEYLNKPFYVYADRQSLICLEKEFINIVNGQEAKPVEARIQHKNGHWVWLEVSMAPLIEDGEIKQVACISRDITEQKKQQEVLTNLAFKDYLTGLPNRRVFDDTLEKVMNEAQVNGKKVAVMMIDGLKFKEVNDTYGHDAGDEVIRELGIRIQSCLRKTDMVARFGGDEMGVIVPNLDSEDIAIGIAQRIINSLKRPLYYYNQRIKIGVGIGISFYPEHGKLKKQLLKYADNALYDAKELRESSYKVFS